MRDFEELAAWNDSSGFGINQVEVFLHLLYFGVKLCEKYVCGSTSAVGACKDVDNDI